MHRQAGHLSRFGTVSRLCLSAGLLTSLNVACLKNIPYTRPHQVEHMNHFLPMAIMGVLLSAPASAGEDECVSCCRAGGLVGCQTTIRMFAKGSVAVPESGAWRIRGLWLLRCDGTAIYEPGATTATVEEPEEGQLLTMGLSPMVLHCFSQACSLPAASCLFHEQGGTTRLLHCGDGRALSREELSTPGPAPPGPESVVVAVRNRPLVVVPDTSLSRADMDVASACGGCRASLGAYSVTAPKAVVSRNGAASGRSSAATGIDLSVGVPIPGTNDSIGMDGSTVGDSGASPLPRTSAMDLDLPDPPESESCATPEALRHESRKHLDLGDEAMVQGDDEAAMKEYLAALTLDQCNGYAWANIGDLALKAHRPRKALVALQQAIRFLPMHYTALTNLGRAYQALGNMAEARAAFNGALQLQPGYAPAARALMELQ